MRKSFRGGIFLPAVRNASGKEIRKISAPSTVKISIPASFLPTVNVGERVFSGSVIAQNADGEKIHSSVSGKVSEVGEGIVITNDFTDERDASLSFFPKRISEATREEMLDFIREKGISEPERPGVSLRRTLDGAKSIGTVIVNLISPDPALSSVHRLAVEKMKEIIGGIKVVRRILCPEDVVFAVADEETEKHVTEALSAEKGFSVVLCRPKYPISDERLLAFAVTGKKIPVKRKISDFGISVIGAETAVMIYEAFVFGTPMIKRVITVAGDAVSEKANLEVPIGTSFEDVISFCGGFARDAEKVVSGGVMRGETATLDETVDRSTCGILCLTPKRKERASECIRCGDCIGACPMKLMPLYIAQFSKSKNLAEAEKFGLSSCIECGACSYVCPAKLPLLTEIKKGRMEHKEK